MKNFLYLIITVSLFNCSGNHSSKSLSAQTKNTKMITIDNKQTFIIGTYYLPQNANPYKTLAENGFNYFRAKADSAELDSAFKYGLKTWIHLGSIKNGQKRDESENKVRTKIETFKNHPALLCWELEDEPAYTWNSAKPRILLEQMIETYKVVKSVDPKHLIYMNHAPVNLVSTMQKYNDSADILACDIYPVIPHGIRPTHALLADGLQGDRLNPYISQVGEYAERLKRVSSEKPFFMVLQGFAWEMLKPESERNPQMIVYPSYEQLRFMAYNAIIHDANGIIYWGTKYTPANEPFWNDLFKVTRELESIQKILTAPVEDFPIEKEYHELGYSVDGGVEILIKQFNGSVYLLTANIDKHQAKISFNKISGFTKAEVLTENREILISGETLTDDYKPFDVHIYKLTN